MGGGVFSTSREKGPGAFCGGLRGGLLGLGGLVLTLPICTRGYGASREGLLVPKPGPGPRAEGAPKTCVVEVNNIFVQIRKNQN